MSTELTEAANAGRFAEQAVPQTSVNTFLKEVLRKHMGDRIDETKGNVKKGLGNLTGNDKMEAEGRTEADTAHARRQVKGAGNQVKGSVEEGLGKVTGDDETRARGTADRIKGDAQRTG